MQSLLKDYKNYKWFITSSGKTVVGGKNAIQNDELLKRVIKVSKPLMTMHTSSPGSPFSIIISSPETITKQDLEECSTFTACFSHAWKSGKSKAEVDIFESIQLHKEKNMKAGTWSVKGKVKKVVVPLKLFLIKQNGILRCVPEITSKKSKEILLQIVPGTVDKKEIFIKLISSGMKFNQEEFLSALPAGGSRISQ